MQTDSSQLNHRYTRLEDFARVSDFVSQLLDVARHEGDLEGEAHALVLSAKCQSHLGSPQQAIETRKCSS